MLSLNWYPQPFARCYTKIDRYIQGLIAQEREIQENIEIAHDVTKKLVEAA